jgi:hypothetical protein
MSTGSYARYSLLGGAAASSGVTIYPNFAAFPASAPNGTVAKDAGAHILYEYNSTTVAWEPIASYTAYQDALDAAGAATSIGALDAQAANADGLALVAHVLSTQSADATHPGMVNTTTQSFAGNKTFTGTIAASNLSGTNTGDVTLGTANGLSLLGQALSLDLSSTATTGSLSSTDWNTFNSKQGTITIGALDAQAANADGLALVANVLSTQSADATHAGLVNTTTQSFAGNKTFTGTISASNLSGTNTGDVTMTAVGAVPNANGASLSGQALTLQPADATNPGLLTSGTQSIGGAKTFSGGIDSTALTNCTLGVTNTITAADSTFSVVDNLDNTKTLVFQLANQTAGATTTLVGRASANRSINLPNADCTILGASSSPAQYTVVLGAGSGLLTSTGTGTAGQPLLSGGPSANPDYGTLSIGAGGTGQTTKAAAFDALSPMTTGGDIIYGGASGTGTRLANGTAGQILTSQGTTLAPIWSSALTPVAPTIQTFTSGSGTYTLPVSPRSPLYIRVRMVGGGGGGGGSGTALGSAGGTGGNTTFGTTLLAANGGSGGGSWSNNLGGAGGSASLGTGPIGTALTGGMGGSSTYSTDTSVQQAGGSGAPSPFGGGGRGASGGAAGSDGAANTGAGGGGGAVSTTANAGSGAGGGAGGFVDALISSPSSTYSYAIGAGGTAGGAGTSGYAGGVGGSGYIEVCEFYQ